MVCIYCGGSTKVTNSRHQKRTNEVWRRRHCLVCKGIFTTYEVAALETGIVVQYSGKDLRPFSREKLFVDLYESCRHQPDAITEAAKLTQTITTLIISNAAHGGIHRDAVIETCRTVLRRYDPTIEAVYTAYHRSRVQ